MQSSRITTDKVAGREAFSFWRDVICETFIRLDCSAQNRSEFAGGLSSYPLGNLQLSSMTSDQIGLTRSPSRIASAREEYCLVVVQGRGRTLAEQDGRQVVLDPGDIAMFDSTRPYSAELLTGFHHFVIKVPREVLKRRLGPIEAFTAQKISGNRGIGSVTSRFVRSLPRQLVSMDDMAVQHVAESCLGLLTAALAGKADVSGSTGTSTRMMHVARAKAFIASNLQDGALSPGYVATSLGISERYLAALFAEEGLSISRLIWKQRIERCKTALSDSSQNHRSVTEIAFGWGFNDASHFSHLFKRQTGTSPRRYRVANTGVNKAAPNSQQLS